ncbi:dephospho-CoA kinase, partial [Desulfovibrio sp. 1214_IL3152]
DRLRGGLLTTGGAVNRTALMAAMQKDPVLRRDVEQTVHALTRQRIDDFWQQQESKGAALAAAEIPLYFECGWQKVFNPAPFSVGVHCPLSLRSARTAKNRGWSQEKMAALEEWQWPEARKMAACDLVIANEDDLPRLHEKAADLIEKLRLLEQEKREEQSRTLVRLWTPS